MKKLTYLNYVTLGCDPEFFFSKNGAIVGSEKVLDKNGFVVNGNYNNKFVIDGVQAELNPAPNTCRALLGNEIRNCFKQLSEKIGVDKDLKIDFSPVVNITNDELQSLSESSRVFGCSPSLNTHQSIKGGIKVNPSKYLKRSAGGHLHFGCGDYKSIHSKLIAEALKAPKEVISLMDYILGNTCVLLDTNTENRERRKNYGKAGEYRVTKFGLEFRTLSNFWLRSEERRVGKECRSRWSPYH